jgi:hypothetical protein
MCRGPSSVITLVECLKVQAIQNMGTKINSMILVNGGLVDLIDFFYIKMYIILQQSSSSSSLINLVSSILSIFSNVEYNVIKLFSYEFLACQCNSILF